MPITGGTRMLRARRKDCNVKPNRRLDRKSSRGMLYENEELRMRTITINAEVEQGQHALKKLRRENEQLRREMWSLRDEYDKMEKLLRKKEMDDESNQENSDSEANLTRTDDSEEETPPIMSATTVQQDEKGEQDEDDHLKSVPETESNVRNFDGLSVIDEQTEETQTTDSPLGCATSTRGNSEVNPSIGPPIEMYDEACGLSQFTQYIGGYTGPVKPPPAAKRKSPYENGHFPGSWPPVPVCDAYESRPASPYPYNGILHRDSYRKRFQVLENLSPLAPSGTTVPETGWILPDSSKSTELPEYDMFLEGAYLPEKPAEGAPALPPADFPYDLVQDRTGPDVFVTDGYPQGKEEAGPGTDPKPNLMANLEAKLDGVKIGPKTEMDPKTGFEPRGGPAEGGRGGEGGGDDGENRMTTQLTKSLVSREAAALGLAKIPWAPQQTPDPAKLTIDESPGENDNNRFPSHVRTLVSCQNPFGQDVCDRFAPGTDSKPPRSQVADEMPQTDKSGLGGPGGSSKYQTKLTVTLKTPTLTRPEGKKPVCPTNLGPPTTRTFPNQAQNHAFRYGLKPEYATMRFQTFPSSAAGCQQQGPRTHATNGRDCLVNHYAGVRTHPNGLSGSLPRLPAAIPKPLQVGFKASHIPVTSLDKEMDVLPDQESPATPSTGPTYSKPVKIPPVPPPRTSSYPKHIIPGTPMQGGNLLQQRTYTQGKQVQGPEQAEPKPMDPIMYNPLLLSQPIATSSPTISLRMTKNGPNSSNENLYLSRFHTQNYYDESSNEDLTRQKSKLRNQIVSTAAPGGRKLNKSLSSPSFDTFRTLRRKQSEQAFANSVDNILSPAGVPSPDKPDRKQPAFKGHGQSNVSVSSSSGLDSPVKSDRRKRRVSIQFKKHQQQVQQDIRRGDEDKEPASARHAGLAQGVPSTSRTAPGFKLKGKMDETDATTSERERTNSISSRTSSIATGSGSRRKFSTSSNRTYLNDEKIPWCGCWGNGCI